MPPTIINMYILVWFNMTWCALKTPNLGMEKCNTQGRLLETTQNFQKCQNAWTLLTIFSEIDPATTYINLIWIMSQRSYSWLYKWTDECDYLYSTLGASLTMFTFSHFLPRITQGAGNGLALESDNNNNRPQSMPAIEEDIDIQEVPAEYLEPAAKETNGEEEMMDGAGDGEDDVQLEDIEDTKDGRCMNNK